jgi:mannan endo-1,4-beta-mannosidase
MIRTITMMMRNILIATSAVLVTAASVFSADKYEAETFVTNETQTPKVALASASGGYYVQMKEGDLTFTVSAAEAGFYTVWAYYSQTYADSKTQNLVVNGSQAGTIAFPATGEDGAPVFKLLKAVGKVRLKAGSNTLAITKSWGWVDIDYIEVGPYVPAPFTVSGSLVTPNASQGARKVYGFIRDNFQKKIISGVMTENVTQNDGNYTPHTHASQPEMAHIYSASGKFPALMGLDFMHGTGEQARRPDGKGDWFIGYNNAAIALAETFYKAGGIPIFCWHWRDPLKQSTNDQSFYTKEVTFDLTKAFTNSTYEAFNVNSAEYKGLMEDIDTVASFLKRLADKNVPVLWRPLHEAAGGWFWWGAKGPKPCAQLYRLMFDRFVNHHGLKNLIWVWTTEESGRELEWYPGDEYVDIVGRDYYPSPDQGARATGSLVSSFENIKEIFGARKIITLSENGSVPYPDSLKNDGAEWSWFMSWNGRFATDVNTRADWNHIMNHSYVITLENMPGWDNYTPTSVSKSVSNGAAARHVSLSVRGERGSLELNIKGMGAQTVELFNLRGSRVAVLSKNKLGEGVHRFAVKGIAKQMCFVRVTSVDKKVVTLPVRIE